MQWNLSTRNRALSQFVVAGFAAALASGMLWTGVAVAQPQHDAFDKVMGYDSGREETAAHNYLDQTGREDAYGESQQQYQGQYNGNNNQRRAGNYQQPAASGQRTTQPGTNGQYRQYAGQPVQNDRSRAYSSSQNRGGAAVSNAAASQGLGVHWSMVDGRLKAEHVNQSGELAQEGLERGDQIVSVGGRRIRSEAELNHALSSVEAGQEVPIVVSRNGRRQTLFWAASAQQAVYNQHQRSTVGQSSDAQHSGYNQNQAAANAQRQQHESGYSNETAMGEANLTVHPQLMQGPRGKAFLGVQLDRNHGDRAFVSHIYPNSPAERAGLQPGDVILAVNGHEVGAPDDLTAQLSQLRPGQRVQLAVDRSEGQRNLQDQEEGAGNQQAHGLNQRHSGDTDSGYEYSPED